MGNFQENDFFKFCLLILEREGGRDMEQEREQGRNIDLSFQLLMYSLVDSCMYPDRVSNLEPWVIRTTLDPTDLPNQC